MRYYKLVRRLNTGRLVSQFVDPGFQVDGQLRKRLTYRRGKVTEAPKESNGVYLYTSLDHARSGIFGNTNPHFFGNVVCFRAYPIGAVRPLEYAKNIAQVPAVRLGRRAVFACVYGSTARGRQ